MAASEAVPAWAKLLIDKGEAPVKPAYVWNRPGRAYPPAAPAAALPAAAAAPAEGGAAGTGEPQAAEGVADAGAVAGAAADATVSTIAGAAEGAAEAAPATGARGGARGDWSLDRGAGAGGKRAGGPLEQKSKGKARREHRQQQARGICHAFLRGACTYGASCKFNHDVASFEAERPEDLPGPCPFEAARGSCPFSISCRYGRTHKAAPASAAEGSDEAAAERDAAAAVAAGGAADAAGDAAAAAPAPVRLSDADYLARLTRPAPLDDDAPPLAGLPPTQAMPLPLPASIEAEINQHSLERGVQALLRKNHYDFTQADTLLKSMGVTVTAAMRPKGGAAGGWEDRRGGKGKGGRDGAKGDGGVAGAAADEGAAAAGEGSAAAEAGAPAEAAAGAAPPAAAAAPPDPSERAGGTELPLRPREKKLFDVRGKLYLAPLTTVGNLPFRRCCVGLGADITCGEMALATNLLQGQTSEWALLKRHPCEKYFGAQVCGGFPDALGRVAQLLSETTTLDFIDVNMGCPIDLVCNKGAGSALLLRPNKMEMIIKAMAPQLDCPLTFKTRMGYHDGQPVAHTLIPRARGWGAAAVTLHGRSRQQRYSRQADWAYIKKCAAVAPVDLPLIGNGDVCSFDDYEAAVEGTGVATVMIARGALIKPWVFTEIKERRHWDISSGERLDLLKSFCAYGLEHWGADSKGVETTRRFLLEWLSFMHRYVPVGLLEVLPQKLHLRAPRLRGRDPLETLLASPEPSDWVAISAMLLGPPPASFHFAAKHKANAQDSEAGMANG